MEFSVKLSHLPAGFKFPERLKSRVRHDADSQKLIYVGFMTKCTYDELSALTDDVDYHRALERLFVLTSGETTNSQTVRLPAAAIAAAIGAIALAAGAIWFAAQSRPANTPSPIPTEVAAVTPPER